MSIDLREYVTRQQFTEQLHTTFTLQAGEIALSAELVDVTVRADLTRQDQFSLVFRVAADTLAAQWSWEVEHPVLGSQPMLLVPVRRDANGLYLEAAFNRLITEAAEEA